MPGGASCVASPTSPPARRCGRASPTARSPASRRARAGAGNAKEMPVAEKKTPVSKLSFNDAVAEVEAIVDRLENDQTDVDELAGEVQRAVELITSCRERLERTDSEVRELVTRLQKIAPTEDDAPPASDAADVPF
ncbi:exodeoxyribonuclease VII small subunit [bacterium]|nr:exodeoxyribonuclease VII small subunit [bacterium]